jgi:hypothetical protein
MSKYNLTDIFEQYKIGSGWTNDFDYEGMLKTGLGTSIDTPVEVLKKLSDDFEDVNYHRENNHLQYAIEAIEIGDMMEAEGRFSDFHDEIRKTMETFDMDIEPTVGQFMASKIKEDKYDDIVDADDDIPADKKKEAAAAYRKVDKGASYEKATSHIKEVSSRVGYRIEGLLNIPMKKKFLDAGMDLIQDVLEDDIFDISDIIEHLAIELEKYYDGFLDQGDRLAGLEEDKAMSDTEAKLEAGEIGTHLAEESKDSIEEALPKFKGVPPMKDIVKALKNDAKATDSEIKQFMASVKKAGDEFDDVDDYVEDFKNYVADKALQEHFGRFMKDYQ